MALALVPAAVSAQTLTVTNAPVVWFDASFGVALDGSSWQDKSGNGHHASALVGQAPTLNMAGPGGLPTLDFAGGQTMLLAGSPAIGPTWSIYAVVTDTGPAPGLRNILSNWHPSNSFTSMFMGTVGATPSGRFTDDVGGAFVGNVGVGTITTPADPFILAGHRVFNGATAALDLTQYSGSGLTANLLGSASGTTVGGSNATTPFYIGRQGALAGEYWQGAISEILVFSGTLSSSDRKNVRQYLGEKYLGTVAAVPEPSTWLQLLFGFAFTGLLARRRALKRAAA
ncbi:hypothetical protein CAP39_02725 [Sphingomonas sp. IBVSS1]|nr:hypothetical protein CAP39_02725 [Sphingomonas sp. IBVSS1]